MGTPLAQRYFVEPPHHLSESFDSNKKLEFERFAVKYFGKWYENVRLITWMFSSMELGS